MALLHKPLAEITASDLGDLIEDKVRENQSVEYKSLIGRDDKAKANFLGAVTSFANTSGGDLIIGVQATEDGLPECVTGWVGVNLDDEKQRLNNLLRDGTQPRLTVQMREVQQPDSQPPVLIIRVNRSWAAPHMVSFNGMTRFYYRTSSGKEVMNQHQIRDAFAQTFAIEERVRQFRTERIEAILQGQGLLTSAALPTILFHVVPFDFSRSGARVDIAATRAMRQPILPLSSGGDERINLDGLLCVDWDGNNQCRSYSLLFRNGAVEFADRNIITKRADEYGRRSIPSRMLLENLIRATSQTFALYQRLGIPPPFFIMLTLLGVEGLTLAVELRLGTGSPIDRPALLLPEVVADDLSSPVESMLKPVLDSLWNAGGFARCHDYGDNGRLRR